jgi:hypothetical protein
MNKKNTKLKSLQILFALSTLTLFLQPSFAAFGETYNCNQINFVVNNNHDFTRQNNVGFQLTRHKSYISIKGGFLTGSEFDYNKINQNKFFGSGTDYVFSFDNGYFQWVKVSKYINELYIITANCR